MAGWVPDSFWQGLFLEDNETLATIWGPLIGPVVAVISFVCSIGNVPLAAIPVPDQRSLIAARLD